MDIDWINVVTITLVALTQYARHVGKPEWIIGIKLLSKIWDEATGNAGKAENLR